jgi:CheY-like chemotaxis protein
MSGMSIERRAHPRFPLILAVQYAGAETVLDYSENLAAGSLFIRTEREFELGERVTLVVSFPQRLDPVELMVEIVRRRAAKGDLPGGVAVRVPEDRKQDLAKLADIARVAAGARGPEPTARVLLVEDNALVATMYQAVLRRLSEADHLTLGVEVAKDGGDAFARLLRSPPVDILVTDVFMPEVSGITLVERVRAEPALAHLPIIVVSSGGEPEREKLAALGIEAFLAKPVSYQELTGAVRAVISSRPVRSPRPTPGGDKQPAGLTDEGGVSTDRPDAMPASRR